MRALRYSIVILLVPTLMSCSEDGSLLGTDCTNLGSGVAADIRALIAAGARLDAASLEIDTDVKAACNAISTDLGKPALDDTAQACESARSAIAEVNAGIDAQANATIDVQYTPPRCEVNLDASASCVADCDAMFDATVTPPTCEGGRLTGSCSGMCEGSCTVEGTVECTGSCEGSCQGECSGNVTGSCEGTCQGHCDGSCSAMDANGNCQGSCDGTCSGTCTGTVDARCSGSCSGMCEGSCRSDIAGSCSGSCTGSCDVDFVAPRCEGGQAEVTAEVECEAACEANATFDAECSEPQVVVAYSIAGNAALGEDVKTLQSTLQTNLPALLRASAKAEGIVSAGADFASRLGDVAGSAAGLTVRAAACTAEAVSAQTKALASINVSVMASVSITAEASATTTSSD